MLGGWRIVYCDDAPWGRLSREGIKRWVEVSWAELLILGEGAAYIFYRQTSECNCVNANFSNHNHISYFSGFLDIFLGTSALLHTQNIQQHFVNTHCMCPAISSIFAVFLIDFHTLTWNFCGTVLFFRTFSRHLAATVLRTGVLCSAELRSSFQEIFCNCKCTAFNLQPHFSKLSTGKDVFRLIREIAYCFSSPGKK